MFGYLQNNLKYYAEGTLHVHVNVVQREVGIRPLLVFNPRDEHRLAVDHRNGVDRNRADEMMSTWDSGR